MKNSTFVIDDAYEFQGISVGVDAFMFSISE